MLDKQADLCYNTYRKEKELTTMLKMICFDMDGTIADLYGVPGWLEQLRAFDATPYAIAKPLCDVHELSELLYALRRQGIEIRIITWLSKETNRAYDKAVRMAKCNWLYNHFLPFDHFHGVAYGATKADSVRRYLGENETAILFDDNAKVRQGWHLGEAYDPAEVNICEILRNILGAK